ncbi:nef protein [Anopheles sinensis]|uniref:Nef protein n=1 Tax=Anopheles sinensis TaxID=74873 RepID=A0A084VS96_ANOSI|nr:nef protein [Anopheles sinensis]
MWNIYFETQNRVVVSDLQRLDRRSMKMDRVKTRAETYLGMGGSSNLNRPGALTLTPSEAESGRCCRRGSRRRHKKVAFLSDGGGYFHPEVPRPLDTVPVWGAPPQARGQQLMRKDAT